MANPKKPRKKSALGRGLGALLSDSSFPEESGKLATDTTLVNRIDDIPLSHIEVNPFQPRTAFDQEKLEELAESIRTQGIIQPITVRKLSDQKFQLISGERRYHAAALAGLKKIPAYIRRANDQQMLEMALIENIQRENLNAIEIASSYQRLITECNLKQEDLGNRVGKKRSTVTNYLRLLKLPSDIQAAIRDEQLTMGHARALISVENVEMQLEIYKRIIRDDLSVRQVELLVRKIQKESKGEKKPKVHELNYELKQLQEKLSAHFGTKVRINDKGQRGELRIPYLSYEDLNRILEILNL